MLFFIFLYIYGNATSQNINSEIDSILQHALILESNSPLKSHAEAKAVLVLSKKHNYSKGLIQAEMFLSESYTRGKNHQLALFYATSVEKRISDVDFYSKAKALRLKGISLGRLGFYDAACKFLDAAILYAEKIEIDDDRNENLGYIYANMAENYQENEIETDSVGYYFRKSFTFFDEINDKNIYKNRSMAFANVNLGTFNLRGQEFDKAKPYLDKALIFSKQYDLDFITIEALSGLGSLNYYKKNYIEAKVNFEEGLLLAKSKNRIFYINDLYYNLSKTYKNLNEKDSSNYYRERYITLNDSLLKSHKVGIDNSLRLFLEEKEQKTAIQLKVIIICISIVLILILITFMYMFLYKKRLEGLRQESETINEQLKRKQDLIQKLISEKSSSEDEINELMDLIVSGNPSFFIKFKEMHSDYVARIIEITPNILLSELRFCALIKLGFSTSEIATYTKSTIRSVESRRYRLRKKLNIPSDVDLSDWLASI